MDILLRILQLFLALSILILIHELGHFLVARHFGVYCKEFSLGMGPLIYAKQGKETQFSIRAIPFGGFVMMAGEEDGSQDEEEDWLKDLDESRRLNFKPRWQQVCVMVAGVLMNILLAWVLYIGLAMAQGYVVEDPLPVVYEIVPAQPYTSADLSYRNDGCRANAEQQDPSARPAVAGSGIADIDAYDTVYVGFPVWWGRMPKIMFTFFDAYDFSGKTIRPFCTSGGSGIAASVNEIRGLEPQADVQNGLRVRSLDDLDGWL